MLRTVELFSGIGAQRMALILAGIPHEVTAISEIDKHALASYEAIYGDCPNLGDISKIKCLPDCDLLTWSFPCTDLSIAGKRAGMGEGTRSGLAWEVLRLLESAGERERPEWLLMENVPQVLTAPEWPEVIRRLEAMGYHNKWGKLDSSQFGSAQKRVRAFMVSRLGQEPPDLPESDPGAPSLCLRDVMEPERPERFVRRIPLDRIKWRNGPETGSAIPSIRVIADDDSINFDHTARIYSQDGLSPVMICHGGGNRDIKIIAVDTSKRYGSSAKILSSSTLRAQVHGLQNQPKVLKSEDNGDLVVSVLTPRECWRLMGFPEWAFIRASKVCSETQLYNQAGNSIVVEVLESIFRTMFSPWINPQKTLGEWCRWSALTAMPTPRKVSSGTSSSSGAFTARPTGRAISRYSSPRTTRWRWPEPSASIRTI